MDHTAPLKFYVAIHHKTKSIAIIAAGSAKQADYYLKQDGKLWLLNKRALGENVGYGGITYTHSFNKT